MNIVSIEVPSGPYGAPESGYRLEMSREELLAILALVQGYEDLPPAGQQLLHLADTMGLRGISDTLRQVVRDARDVEERVHVIDSMEEIAQPQQPVPFRSDARIREESCYRISPGEGLYVLSRLGVAVFTSPFLEDIYEFRDRAVEDYLRAIGIVESAVLASDVPMAPVQPKPTPITRRPRRRLLPEKS